jgi:hypothetical protein
VNAGRILLVVPLVLGSRSWSAAASGPDVGPSLGVRNAHALAYDSDRGRVLLFGGADEGKVLGDLWEWDGKTWQRLASEGPPPRTFPALAYDRARRRLVLFGGNRVLFGDGAGRDTFLADMWEWYEGSWHTVAAPAPPARSEAAMVYDSARRRLALFGGYHGTGAGRERFGDTWEFDGSVWKRIETPRGPSPRNGAALAYDSGRGRVVLFGGSGGPNAETWEWDGSLWVQVVAPAAGRYNSAMAYDMRLEQVIRFGGWSGERREGDTWRYDGRRWEPAPGRGPEPRNHASMAYDERRGVLVLFGGHDGELVFGDTWEYRAGSWSRVGFESPRRRIENGH